MSQGGHIAPGTKKALFYHAKPHPHGFHCEEGELSQWCILIIYLCTTISNSMLILLMLNKVIQTLESSDNATHLLTTSTPFLTYSTQ